MYQQGYLNVGVVKSRSKGKENPDASSCVRDDNWSCSEQGQQSVPEQGATLYAETITGLQWKLSFTQATDQGIKKDFS